MKLEYLSAEKVQELAQYPLEEVLAKLQEEGYELTDEQLEKVSGGVERDWTGKPVCPKCGEYVVSYNKGSYFWCSHCDYEWWE